MKQVYSNDDVLLVPKRTFGGSRNKVSLKTEICGWEMNVPILSANMSSVTEAEMAIAMRRNGGLGVLHRMCSPENQESMVKQVFAGISEADAHNTPVFVSIEGSLEAAMERIDILDGWNPYGFCLDVAHADSPDVEATVVGILKRYPRMFLIIGNYATPQGIINLLYVLKREGVYCDDILDNIAFKIGIGSGSHCTTRVVTGCGLPTLESIRRIRQEPELKDVVLIADGGFKNSGDIVKALAMGANAVMLGSLLAGTKETPGNVIKTKDGLHKVYRGSASYGQKFETGKNGFIEGEESLVPYKGHLSTILTSLTEGIKSGFSYCGAQNISELQENAEFVQVTNSGYREGTAHGTI